MKKQTLNKFISTGIALTMTGALLAGCSSSTAETEVTEEAEVTEETETATEAAEETTEAAAADEIYNDANGWSVQYDPSVITVNQGGPVTTFVYTGESAGTNMITATYSVDSDAMTAIENLAKDLGDNVITSENIFPGTEDVPSYNAILPPSEDGSGLHETAIARDYMDGYLLFEYTGHNSGDDSIDIPVSDALSSVIDSITFNEN